MRRVRRDARAARAGAAGMSLWVVVAIVLVGLWLAFKAVGLLLRIALWALVLGAVYWFIAPHLGLPVPWR